MRGTSLPRATPKRRAAGANPTRARSLPPAGAWHELKMSICEALVVSKAQRAVGHISAHVGASRRISAHLGASRPISAPSWLMAHLPPPRRSARSTCCSGQSARASRQRAVGSQYSCALRGPHIVVCGSVRWLSYTGRHRPTQQEGGTFLDANPGRVRQVRRRRPPLPAGGEWRARDSAARRARPRRAVRGALESRETLRRRIPRRPSDLPPRRPRETAPRPSRDISALFP